MTTRRTQQTEAGNSNQILEIIVRTKDKVKPTASAKPTKWPRASTRIGKRGLNMWVDQSTFVAVGNLARQEDKTIQDLLVEALSDVLASRGI